MYACSCAVHHVRYLWIEIVFNDLCPSQFAPVMVLLFVEKHSWIALREMIQIL